MPGTGKRPTIFITGAGSGLGRALVHYYGRQGARLGLLARRPYPLQELARHYEAKFYLADVRNAASVVTAAHEFLTQVGTPDIVIGCAGISVGTLTQEREDLRVFQAVMDANVMGLVHTFHPFIQAMSERGSGVLCGITSPKFGAMNE
ncbi:MAG: SDR family NAD(P)-dependent oxidoreductase [Thiobacillaceae bacterium]